MSLHKLQSCGCDASFRGEGDLSLEAVLASRQHLAALRDFCNEEHCIEYLLFLLEVRDMRETVGAHFRTRKARLIVRKFLLPDSPMPLVLLEHMRRPMLDILHPGATNTAMLLPAAFDDAYAFVYYSLRLDIYPRFVHSRRFQELLNHKIQCVRTTSIADFDILRFLGVGGFGMVLLTKHTRMRRNFAMKVVDKSILVRQNQVHAAFREREVLALVTHPFIVTMHFAFTTDHHLCFVFEYCDCGNMYKDLAKGPYPHERACYYAAMVVLAIEHIHGLDVLYRDLKPDNVLLMPDGTIRLADMGAVRGITEDGSIYGFDDSSTIAHRTSKSVADRRRMTITGTHGYRAPEVYERDYGKAADWWNVGLLIIEMLTTVNPLRGPNRKASEYKSKCKDVTIPASIRPEAADIVTRFVERNPEKRLGSASEEVTEEEAVDEIKRHSFFGPIDFELLYQGELPPPFDLSTLDCYSVEPEQPLTPESNSIDFYCQRVDYMMEAKQLRDSGAAPPLRVDPFDDFGHISLEMFEEEMVRGPDSKRNSWRHSQQPHPDEMNVVMNSFSGRHWPRASSSVVMTAIEQANVRISRTSTGNPGSTNVVEVA